jgi:hypothetical protein
MAMTSTAQLERETEATRAELEHTLDELRTRMSPGQLIDQAADYMRNSGGRAFLGNLRHQVVNNPLPVTLIGAGIAWLAISGAIARRGNGHPHGGSRRDWGDTAATAEDLARSGRATAEGWAARAREGAEEAAERTRETAEDWIDEGSDTLSEAGERLRDTADEAQRRASRVYDKTVGRARQAAGDAAHYPGTARRRVVHSGEALMDFCREQPMLVAGLGVALGAALGAMLPSTRAERQVMGEASRDAQEKASDLVAEQYERAKRAGSDLWEEAKERASEELDDGLKQAADAASGAPQRRDAESEPQSAAPYAEAAEAGQRS